MHKGAWLPCIWEWYSWRYTLLKRRQSRLHLKRRHTHTQTKYCNPRCVCEPRVNNSLSADLTRIHVRLVSTPCHIHTTCALDAGHSCMGWAGPSLSKRIGCMYVTGCTHRAYMNACAICGQTIINPRRTYAARVTVLGLCVCVCVCPSTLFSYLVQLRSKQEIRATSASHGQ